ncbi:hypothetical protein HOV93_30100 [Planctomycetes bacterium FF15]|uniref:Uncharacterized protein n=1 Tax=Bremerella alba TaxID=980252 RepID=A0A7V8V6X7_9BACT|nr:hypothetical protein [Bremerella alba]
MPAILAVVYDKNLIKQTSDQLLIIELRLSGAISFEILSQKLLK